MKPLTIEQLKELEVGDWVWITTPKNSGEYYQISYSDYLDDEDAFVAYSLHYDLNVFYSDYGTKWLAYKNKEQAEANGEIVELPEPFIDTDKNAYEETTYLVYRPRVEVYCPSEDIYSDKI